MATVLCHRRTCLAQIERQQRVSSLDCTVCHRRLSRPSTRTAAASNGAAQTDLDVAVIGGGPGGLAAAHAVSAGLPSCRVAVFERVPQLMKRGAGFQLDVNGQKALHAINPEIWSAAQARGKVITGFRLYDNHGNLFKQEDYLETLADMKERYGYGSFLMAWADMQKLLAETLPSSVPLHLGCQFERYEEAEDGTMRLHLVGQDTPITTKLLVAADGYFSRVRQQCLADGPPTWAGTCVWRATVPEEFAVTHGASDGSSLWYAGDYLSSLVFLVSGGQAVWVALAPEAKLVDAGIDFLALQQSRLHVSAQAGDFQEKTRQLGKAAKERCLKVFDKFPDPLKAMFRATDDAAVVEHGIYIRTPEDMRPESFGRGRVVIIGDASHPMRPTGQGLNTALEDAYFLARALAEAGGITDAALQRFRSSRAQRMVPIIARSNEQGQSVYRKDAETAAANMRPPEEYEEYCYCIQLEPLSQLAAAKHVVG